MRSNNDVYFNQATDGIAVDSRYEWADVMLLPVNPSVLRIARSVEAALTDLGVSCGYLWTTRPEDQRKHWGDMADFVNWKELQLPVSWYARTPAYTIQMLQGLRAALRYDLRGKFGVFATFIDSGWSPRLLTLACEQQGIPNVLIQEGMTLQYQKVDPPRSLQHRASKIVRKARLLAAPQLFEYVEDGMHMQHACVYGSAQAESLMARGKARENIFITGNPLFDSIVPRAIAAHPRNRTILYAHQVVGDDWKAEVVWWQALVHASRAIGATLIFKTHPRSPFSEAYIRELLGIADDDAAVQFVSHGDIQDMVAEAGVFVTTCSTAAYRAMIEGIPIVVLEGVPSHYRFDLPEHGAALSVRETDDLARTLRMALDDPQARRGLQQGVDASIERHLYRIDGGAAQRVACALASLLPA